MPQIKIKDAPESSTAGAKRQSGKHETRNRKARNGSWGYRKPPHDSAGRHWRRGGGVARTSMVAGTPQAAPGRNENTEAQTDDTNEYRQTEYTSLFLFCQYASACRKVPVILAFCFSGVSSPFLRRFMCVPAGFPARTNDGTICSVVGHGLHSRGKAGAMFMQSSAKAGCSGGFHPGALTGSGPKRVH